jgi:hypothetical protein
MLPLPDLVFKTMPNLETLKLLNHPTLTGEHLPAGLRHLEVTECERFEGQYLPPGLQSLRLLSFYLTEDPCPEKLLVGIRGCQGFTSLETPFLMTEGFLEGLPPGMLHLDLCLAGLGEANFARFQNLHSLEIESPTSVRLPEALVNLTIVGSVSSQVDYLGNLPHLRKFKAAGGDWTWKTVFPALGKLSQLRELVVEIDEPGDQGELDLSQLKEHPTLLTATFRSSPPENRYVWKRQTPVAGPSF